MKAQLLKMTCSLIPLLAVNADAAPQENPPETKKCCPATSKCCGVRWELFGEYLYLQPNGSDLYYAAEAIPLDPDIAIPAASPNWKILEIKPNYHSGFEVGIAVLFDAADVSLALDWERLHTHDQKSFKTALVTDMVGPLFDIGPSSAAYTRARGKISFDFDEVDLDFGKQFCFFDRLHTTVYGGVGFAHIKQTMNSYYSDAAASISRSVNTFSTFNGAGPQLGLDYDYRICNNFFFTGESIASFFMGPIKNRTTYRSFTPQLTALGIPQPNVQETTVPHRTQLIPGFKQKLGLSYVASFNCVKLMFAIGYQCQIYINAVQTVDMTSPQVLPSLAPFTPDVGVFAVGFERTLSNFILTGPYASLDIKF